MSLPKGVHLAYNLQAPDGTDRTVAAELRLCASNGRTSDPEWEIIVQELDLGGRPAILLNVYDDAFIAFRQLPGLFEALAEHRPRTLGAVRAILDRYGATDETPAT